MFKKENKIEKSLKNETNNYRKLNVESRWQNEINNLKNCGHMMEKNFIKWSKKWK